MICSAPEYLRRRVAGAPARGLQLLLLRVQVAQAEVDKFEISVLVDEDVRWLYVSVRAAKLVQILHCRNEFSEQLARLGLTKPAK